MERVGPALRPRLWSFQIGPEHVHQVQPCTIGLACVGQAAPLGLAIGGQLHRRDLTASAALGLGSFVVDVASRCYASVGGGIDHLVFDPQADPAEDCQVGRTWRDESARRLGELFGPWPNA